MGKYEFEYRGKSITLAFSEIFRLWGFWFLEQDQCFSNEIIFYKWKVFDWYLNLKTEFCIFVENWFSLSSKFKTNGDFWFFLNVETTQQYAAADISSKKIVDLCPKKLDSVKIDTKKTEKSLNLLHLYF